VTGPTCSLLFHFCSVMANSGPLSNACGRVRTTTSRAIATPTLVCTYASFWSPMHTARLISFTHSLPNFFDQRFSLDYLPLLPGTTTQFLIPPSQKSPFSQIQHTHTFSLLLCLKPNVSATQGPTSVLSFLFPLAALEHLNVGKR